MAAKTEEQLALEARQLVSNFNFDLKKPKYPQDVETARALYREIFWEKAFHKIKSKNMKLTFDASIFAKSSSCKKCLKTVHEQLKEFSDTVLGIE